MAETVVLAENNAPINTLTVTALRNLCRQLGITGYSNMKKEDIIVAIHAKGVNVAEVVDVKPPAPQAPIELQTIDLTEVKPETPKPWEDSFIEELRNVCLSLEGLPNTNFLPEELLRTITVVKEATKVEDLAHLSEDVLTGYIHQIKQQLPRYQRDVFEAVTLIARATPIHVDVDYV